MKTSLSVVTVVPKPWTTPSQARVDAEYAQCADRLAADSAVQAETSSRQSTTSLEVSFHKYVRTDPRPGGLVDAVKELDAKVLVLGSRPTAASGQVVDRVDRRPAAALVAGAAGDQPARLPRFQDPRPDPAHLRVPGHPGIACTVVGRVAVAGR